MIQWLKQFLKGAAPIGARADTTAGFGFIDAYKRHRNPSPRELLEELKNTAWVCATINAGACATYSPSLYLKTNPKKDPIPKCKTATIHQRKQRDIRDRFAITKSHQIDEVLDHPIKDLLNQPNEVYNEWDLWEITTLYQETIGSAYWLLVNNALGVPYQIWPLASHITRPVRQRDSEQVVDYYEVKGSGQLTKYLPEEIIHLKYPDPRDPYGPGMGPLRAAAEQVKATSEYAAYRLSVFDNNALPSAIISPQEVMGEDERHRIEEVWNQRFRRSGSGRVLVAETGLNVSLLNHSIADLGALAEYGHTRQDIANAFGVPIAFLTAESNLANLQAAESQHMKLAIRPRIYRRDEKINEQLIPRFDPSKRLFLASEDPVQGNVDVDLKQDEQDLKYGTRSINELRADRGLESVPWGNVPWIPTHLAPTDDHVARQTIATNPDAEAQTESANT